MVLNKRRNKYLLFLFASDSTRNKIGNSSKNSSTGRPGIKSPSLAQRSVPAIPMNKSFDSSRLVEEIFETEMNQVQAQLSPNSDEPRLQLANIETDQNCDGGGAQEPKVIEGVAAAAFTTPILKSRSPLSRILNSSEKKNKRVSWVDQKVDDNGGSPMAVKKADEVAKNGVNGNEGRVANGDESIDVFGDTFCDVDLADVSMTGAKKDDSRGLNAAANKSCPKTPGFEVCTEELMLEESGGQNQVNCSTCTLLPRVIRQHKVEFS